jgi:hypothetical protein
MRDTPPPSTRRGSVSPNVDGRSPEQLDECIDGSSLDLACVRVHPPAAPLTASAVARSVASVTVAYRRIIRSVFQPPSAITIGAEKPRLSAIVAPWCRRS